MKFREDGSQSTVFSFHDGHGQWSMSWTERKRETKSDCYKLCEPLLHFRATLGKNSNNQVCEKMYKLCARWYPYQFSNIDYGLKKFLTSLQMRLLELEATDGFAAGHRIPKLQDDFYICSLENIRQAEHYVRNLFIYYVLDNPNLLSHVLLTSCSSSPICATAVRATSERPPCFKCLSHLSATRIAASRGSSVLMKPQYRILDDVTCQKQVYPIIARLYLYQSSIILTSHAS